MKAKARHLLLRANQENSELIQKIGQLLFSNGVNMKITMTQTVKHGKEEYINEDERTVDPLIGKYFIDHDWATSDEYKAEKVLDDGPVTLDIHNSAIGVTDTGAA